MRIRLPFAGTFLLLCLLAGYAGLSSLQLGAYVNDKVLHLLTFFALTAVFYWVVDTGRRRALHFTLVVCTLAGGVGSEFLQAWVPNGRDFDPADIAANLAGSLAALGLCAWYHRRMLERRRLARVRYNALPGEDGDGDGEDLELGEGLGISGGSGSGGGLGQEEGVTSTITAAGGGGERRKTTTLDDAVNNWDENDLDSWDEEENDEDDEAGDGHHGISAPIKDMGKSKGNGPATSADSKKRVD